jgi:hypothetical protein
MCKLLALPANNRLGYTWMEGTNAPAYITEALIPRFYRFIAEAPDGGKDTAGKGNTEIYLWHRMTK